MLLHLTMDLKKSKKKNISIKPTSAHINILPTGEKGPLSSAGKFQTLMVESKDAEYTLFCEAEIATAVTTLVCPLNVILGSASSCDPLYYRLVTLSHVQLYTETHLLFCCISVFACCSL